MLNFPWIEIGIKRPGYFQRNIFIKATEIEDYRKTYKNTGIFSTAYYYSAPSREGTLYGPYMYFDLDHPALAERDPAAWKEIRGDYLALLARLDTYYNIRKQSVKTYFSGQKGLTVLIPSICFDLKPAKNLNEIFRIIAKDIASLIPYWPLKTLDQSVYDRARLLRLVNSQHESSGLFKIPLEFREIMTLELPQILNLARNIRPDAREPNTAVSPLASARVKRLLATKTSSLSAVSHIDYEPPCITHLLQKGEISKGIRNRTLTALASYYLQCKLSKQETFNQLLKLNKTRCIPSLPIREIESIVNSVFRHGYNFGCRSFREISVCRPGECRLAKRT